MALSLNLYLDLQTLDIQRDMAPEQDLYGIVALKLLDNQADIQQQAQQDVKKQIHSHPQRAQAQSSYPHSQALKQEQIHSPYDMSQDEQPYSYDYPAPEQSIVRPSRTQARSGARTARIIIERIDLNRINENMDTSKQIPKANRSSSHKRQEESWQGTI